MLSFTNSGLLPKIILLHAAAVMTPGGVVLIMGHTGAGKSTLSGMLSERFVKIADDLIELTWTADQGWMAENGMKPQRHPIPPAPLRGFVRIYQALHTNLVPIGARKCCQYLTDALFEVAVQRQCDQAAQERLFMTVAQIAREYPGWEYHFPLDQTAIDLFDHHFSSLVIESTH